MRGKFSAYEDAVLRRFYADNRTDYLALLLDRNVDSVYRRADKLGLKKTAAYMHSPEGCYLRRNPQAGAAGRFKPGSVPWNKGVTHPPGWSPGRMGETQFKKGSRPQTWKPIGTERYSKEGYLQRKVRESPRACLAWKAEHVILWERQHGPVPRGHAVVFRDGDKSHITGDNLELVTRAELMRRNTVHNLPRELALVIQLAGALKRKIRGLRAVNSQQWTVDSEQLTVNSQQWTVNSGQ